MLQSEKPIVSVIIPSKNSAKFLRPCLQSIKSQTYTNIELILVDNNSTDDTKEIGKEFGATVYNMGPERCRQFNYGASVANGKYLYRVDSDFVVEPEVIAECVELCEINHLDGVAVHNTSDPTVSFWSKVRKLERDTYIGDDLIVGVRFFTKESFTKIGGFDETLIAAEDFDLHNRFVQAGYKFGRTRGQEVHLGEPRTLREIWDKSFFYGRTAGSYIKKSGWRGVKQTNPIRSSFLKNWRSLTTHPILLIGLVVMLFTRYLAGGLGLSFSLLKTFGTKTNS